MRWLHLSGLAVLAGFAVFGAARLGWGLLRGPSCVTTSEAEFWSPDRIYKAALSKKDCNLGESIVYSVRVDHLTHRQWFAVWDVETDERPERPPKVIWTADRALEITMPTRTLSGKLTQYVGDDLTMTRVYAATKPDAFPNYGP